MGCPFSLRRAGLLLIVYVFSLMQQNLVVMALFLVNSGHMVNGQITCQAKQTQRNLINYNQVNFVRNMEDEVTAIKITLRHYKHSDPAEPVEIFIYRAKPVCPVTVLLAYVNLRGTSPGPLFCWSDLSPISRNLFYASSRLLPAFL